MNSLVTVLGVTRPNFLLLPPILVALGVIAGLTDGGTLLVFNLIPTVLGGLLAHAAVNTLNEVADYRSGLDLTTERTPFSGGSGTLVQHPALLGNAHLLGWLACILLVACGAWLLADVGWGLAPYGLLGLLLIVTYSGPIGRNRWLVLVAPGLGFGPLMVAGSALATTGTVGPSSTVASLVVFFLVNNLLLLNQFPDRHPDAAAGRSNFVISSPRMAAWIYAGFVAAAYGSVLLGVVIHRLPPVALASTLTLPLAMGTIRGAFRVPAGGEVPLSALGQNVAMSLLTPAMLALALGWHLLA